MTGTYSNELNTMQNALTAYTNALQSFLENTKEIRATFNEIAQNEALKDQRATLKRQCFPDFCRRRKVERADNHKLDTKRTAL